MAVSTHGSLAGADYTDPTIYPGFIVSTHGSLAGADMLTCNIRVPLDVSTHGSLAGADFLRDSELCVMRSFNSRLPCGSRHLESLFIEMFGLFQLTAPLREPTRRQ